MPETASTKTCNPGQENVGYRRGFGRSLLFQSPASAMCCSAGKSPDRRQDISCLYIGLQSVVRYPLAVYSPAPGTTKGTASSFVYHLSSAAVYEPNKNA